MSGYRNEAPKHETLAFGYNYVSYISRLSKEFGVNIGVNIYLTLCTSYFALIKITFILTIYKYPLLLLLLSVCFKYNYL